MKTLIINLILEVDKNINNNIDFIPTVNHFAHNEMEQPEIILNSTEGCMEYISSLDDESFICLFIILLNAAKELSFEEEDSLIKAAQIFLK